MMVRMMATNKCFILTVDVGSGSGGGALTTDLFAWHEANDVRSLSGSIVCES